LTYQNRWEENYLLSPFYYQITAFSTLPNLLILLVCFVLIYAILKLYGIPQLKIYSQGFGLIDSKPFYSPERAYEMVAAYGVKGRKFYIYLEIFDYIFAVIYSLFFTINLIYMFPSYKIMIFPLLIIFFEYIENTCILWMLLRFPEKMTRVAQVSNISTIFKSLLIIISFLTILVSFLYS
jgi:hypothetical protein